MGDRTSGKVMRSRLYSHQIGLETQVFYGVSVTDADLVMSDGKSLEGVGVQPDQVAIPTAEDLREQKDSVLARGERRRCEYGSCRSRKVVPVQMETVAQSAVAE